MIKNEKLFYFTFFFLSIFIFRNLDYIYGFFLIFTAVFFLKNLKKFCFYIDSINFFLKLLFFFFLTFFILTNYRRSLNTESFFFEISIYFLFIFFFLIFSGFKNKDKFNLVFGLNYAVTAVSFIGIIYYFLAGLKRLNFPFLNPNVFADVVFLPLLLNLVYFKKNIYFKISFFILSAAFILCFSKGAFLGMAAAVIILIFLNLNAALKKAAVFSVVLLLLIITVFSYKTLKTDPYRFSRVNIYLNSASMLNSNFLTGIGTGNFREYFLNMRISEIYSPGRYGKSASYAHNEFLHIAVENGILLSSLFFALALAVLFLNYKNKPKGFKLVLLIYFSYLLITLNFSVNLHNLFLNFLFCFSFTACFNNIRLRKLKAGFFTRYKGLLALAVTLFFIYFSVSFFSYNYYLKKGTAFHEPATYDKALNNYAFAYKSFKFSPASLIHSSEIYFYKFNNTQDKKYLDLALAYIFEALKKAPAQSYFLSQKSRFFYLNGNINESLYFLNASLKNDPYYPGNYFKKYEILKALEDKRADVYLNKTLFLEPLFLPAHKALKEKGEITQEDYKIVENFIVFYYNTLKENDWSKGYIGRLIKG